LPCTVEHADDVDEIGIIDHVDQPEGCARDGNLAGTCHVALTSQQWEGLELLYNGEDGREDPLEPFGTRTCIKTRTCGGVLRASCKWPCRCACAQALSRSARSSTTDARARFPRPRREPGRRRRGVFP